MTDFVAAFLHLKCIFITVSCNTSDCKIIITVMHLRLALWEQMIENIKVENLIESVEQVSSRM